MAHSFPVQPGASAPAAITATRFEAAPFIRSPRDDDERLSRACGENGAPALTKDSDAALAVSAVPSLLLSSTTKIRTMFAPPACASSDVTALPIMSASLRAGMTTAMAGVVVWFRSRFGLRGASCAGTIRQKRPCAVAKYTHVATHSQPAISAKLNMQTRVIEQQTQSDTVRKRQWLGSAGSGSNLKSCSTTPRGSRGAVGNL